MWGSIFWDDITPNKCIPYQDAGIGAGDNPNPLHIYPAGTTTEEITGTPFFIRQSSEMVQLFLDQKDAAAMIKSVQDHASQWDMHDDWRGILTIVPTSGSKQGLELSFLDCTDGSTSTRVFETNIYS